MFGNLYNQIQTAKAKADQAEKDYDEQQTEQSRANMNRRNVELIQCKKEGKYIIGNYLG